MIGFRGSTPAEHMFQLKIKEAIRIFEVKHMLPCYAGLKCYYGKGEKS